MAKHWKVYRGGPTPRHQDYLSVSIDRRGTISFNTFTHKSLGSPEAVTLMFEEEDSVIGITAGNPRDPEAFAVKRSTGRSTCVVRAAPFCRDMGIKLARTEGFDRPEIDEDGILCLDLKVTHDLTRRKRSSIGGRK